jgi:hypothetical protein
VLLTVSKRLEFSASRRLRRPLGGIEIWRLLGRNSTRYGSGRNYVASNFVFHRSLSILLREC